MKKGLRDRGLPWGDLMRKKEQTPLGVMGMWAVLGVAPAWVPWALPGWAAWGSMAEERSQSSG